MSQFYGQGDLPFMTFTHPDLNTTCKFLAGDKSMATEKGRGERHYLP